MQTRTVSIDGFPFLVGSRKAVAGAVISAIQKRASAVFLAASLHDLARASQDAATKRWYRAVYRFTTDGMPLVWYTGNKYGISTERVYGPSLMSDIWSHLATHPTRITHTLLGPSQNILRAVRRWGNAWGHLNIIDTRVVPHRTNQLSGFVQSVARKNPDVVWIGVGSPKQALVASLLKPLLPHTTIICVGAAFELVSGAKPSTPSWIQRMGFEWLFRLAHEPGRLWRRYLVYIPEYLLRLLYHRPDF